MHHVVYDIISWCIWCMSMRMQHGTWVWVWQTWHLMHYNPNNKNTTQRNRMLPHTPLHDIGSKNVILIYHSHHSHLIWRINIIIHNIWLSGIGIGIWCTTTMTMVTMPLAGNVRCHVTSLGHSYDTICLSWCHHDMSPTWPKCQRQILWPICHVFIWASVTFRWHFGDILRASL